MSLPSFYGIAVETFDGYRTLEDFRDVTNQYCTSPSKNLADFTLGGFKSRPGTVTAFDLGGGTDILHGEIFLKADAAARYFLFLMDDGAIYYSSGGPRTLLLTPVGGVTHFRSQAYGNRAYIFLSNGATGQQEPQIWDTTNLDPLTVAGQSVAAMAAADGAAGSVTIGVHKLWVIYETRSGFRINSRSGGPNNDGKISVTAAGAKVLSLTGIPVHANPSVVKRHIAMTAAALEAGFIALTIENNTATTGTVNIADAQLVNQTSVDDYADYKQPGPNGMSPYLYHDRMVVIDGTSRVWVSEPGLPHTFKATKSFIDVSVDDGDRVTNAFVIRDILYLLKGQKLFATQDNGDDPAKWSVSLVTDGLGTISSWGVDVEAAEQFVAISDFKGAYLFSGGEPQEISRSIKTDWDTQNYLYMHKAKVTIDPLGKRILFALPTGAATLPNKVFVYDYKAGIENGRWLPPWETDTVAGAAQWRGFLSDYRNTPSVRFLVYAASQLVRQVDATAASDNGTAVAWKHRSGYFELAQTGLHLFAGVEMKATGGGSLQLEIFGPDGVSLLTPAAITLAAAPSKDIRRLFLVFKERIFLELGQTSMSAPFLINRLTLYGKPIGPRMH